MSISSPFETRSFPSTVRGTGTTTGEYGETAGKNYFNLLKKANSAYLTSQNIDAFTKMHQQAVRYTPVGTVTSNRLRGIAKDNAKRFAQQEIQHYDLNGDGFLQQTEVAIMIAEPKQPRIIKTNNKLKDDSLTEAEKQLANAEVTKIAKEIQQQASNYLKAVDTSKDGKLDTQEIRTKTLFTDYAKLLYQKDSYKKLLSEKAFNNIDSQVTQILKKPPTLHIFAADGRITPGERKIADVVFQAPDAANRMLSKFNNACFSS